MKKHLNLKVNKIFSLYALMFPVIALLAFPFAGKATANPAPAVAGDAGRGKLLFERRCAGCHSLDQDKEGPRLRNIYGNRAGAVPTFKYSDEMKSAHVTWDDSSLDKWLADPDSVVNNSDMSFHVPSAQERADIIRFLRVSSGK